MSNEWYTSFTFVEATRAVMGGIDLDPASCEQANRVVRATRFYTQQENGLLQPWYGKVFCNPPYGRGKGSKDGKSTSHQQAFAEKLQREYTTGNIEQAVLLSLGNPNSIWFQPFFDFPLCFYQGHLPFYRPDGSTGDFGFPCAFVYLGPNEEKFIEVFSRFGRIVRAIDNPKPRPIARELWADCEVAS